MAQAYYIPLTIDHTQCGSVNSTDFPIGVITDGNVHATVATLKTIGNGGHVANANGYDIRPYSDAALTSALVYELVFYNATTGAVEMWVKKPTLNASADETIYLGYGDAALTTDGSSNTTWSSNFGIVQHLKDGSTLSLADSTANAYSSTNGGATATTGQIDGGAAFNGSQNYLITNGTNIISADDTHTISFWAKANSVTNAPVVWSAGSAVSGVDFFLELITTTSIAWGYRSVGNPDFRTYTVSSVGTGWHKYDLVKTAAGNNGSFYIDSVLQSTFSGTLDSVGTASNLPVYLADYAGGPGGALLLNGQVDEHRMQNVAVTASWVTADYNSQKTSSTFLTYGTEVPVVGINHGFFF